MTAHDVPVARSWAVIDRPYNSDASRLFFSMSAHSKFLEIRRSVLEEEVSSHPSPFPPAHAAPTILMILTNFVEFSRLSADFRDLHNAAVEKIRLPRLS